MDHERIVIEGDNIKQVINLIEKKFGYYSFNPSTNVFIFFNEKYYLRNNSDLMAAIVATIKEENKCEIEIVCGGGSEGLLRSSLGAETDRINKIINYLKKTCIEMNHKISLQNGKLI